MCEATAGDLPISFSWRNGSGVAVSPEDTDGTISVTLSSAGDYGTYNCTATNDIGMGTAVVDVVQASTYKYNMTGMKITVCHLTFFNNICQDKFLEQRKVY